MAQKRRPKRAHNAGTVHRRKDGRWEAKLLVGYDENGKPIRRTFYGKTKEEAEAKLLDARHKLQQGLLLDPSRQTTGEFLTAWFEDCARPNLRPKTVRCYEQIIRIHLAPAIGRIPLAKLSPQHVLRLYRQKQDAGLLTTARLCHAVLHRAMNQAVRWGLISRNPTDAVDRPRVPRKEMRALTVDEAARLLKAAEESCYHALFVLAVCHGLRQGELLALRWADISFQDRTLAVCRQMQRVKVDGKEQPNFSEPKSSRSRRIIALSEPAIAALRRHRVRQAEERLRAGEVWQDHGLVFTTEIGTPLHPSNFIRRHFHPLLEKAGLPRIRFHDLRHTAASLLLQQGVPLKTIQEMLGHSSISLTADTYGHITLAQQKEAASVMDRLFSRR